MKKITYLITLLLVSNLLTSQIINTSLTNCYSDAQVKEIFKGLKQNDYLKLRLDKTEKTLDDATNIMKEQKGIIKNNVETIAIKDELYKSALFQCDQEKEIRDAKIDQLKATMKVEATQAKKNERRKLWQGIKLGGVIGIAGTVAAFLLVK